MPFQSNSTSLLRACRRSLAAQPKEPAPEKDLAFAFENTALSYYVQERPNFALDGQPEMTRHYSTREFFRQMPNALLARYFATRDSAISSMKLKHVDLIEGAVFQDAREVRTKFSKTFKTYFFPVGEDIRSIFAEWVRFLREEKLWGNDDPLFPATRMTLGISKQFEAAGIEQKHWSTATPIRMIFREAFSRAGLPYFNPHSLRKTLAHLGEQICKSPEEFKAWSQNLGHEQVLTTFMSYGTVREDRQGEIIQRLCGSRESRQPDAEDMLKTLLMQVQSGGFSSRVGQ